MAAAVHQFQPAVAVNGDGVVAATWFDTRNSADGSRYDGRLTLKAVFFTLLNWHSTGKIGPSGLEPERYSESRKAEVGAMRAAAKELDAMIAAWAAPEDELMQEYKEIRRAGRDKKRNVK